MGVSNPNPSFVEEFCLRCVQVHDVMNLSRQRRRGWHKKYGRISEISGSPQRLKGSFIKNSS